MKIPTTMDRRIPRVKKRIITIIMETRSRESDMVLRFNAGCRAVHGLVTYNISGRVSSLTIGETNPEMRKKGTMLYEFNTSLSLLRYQSRRHSIYLQWNRLIPFYVPDPLLTTDSSKVNVFICAMSRSYSYMVGNSEILYY